MKNLFLLLLILTSFSCSLSRVSPKQLEKAQQSFAAATLATGPEGATKVDSGLDPIVAEDLNSEGYVAVLAWKNGSDTEKFYGAVGTWDTLSSGYLTWVTQKSQFMQMANDIHLYRFSGDRLTLRMEQLLGLTPNVTKDSGRVFMEMWVKVSDLFRPCRDPEVTDRECSTGFPGGAYSATPPAYDTVYEGLVKNNLNTKAGEGELPYWAPWTRLGYTYDYHPRNRSHFGMSEYIIRQGAIVKIIAKTPTEIWVSQLKR